MTVLAMMQSGVRHMQAGEFLAAEYFFRSICYREGAADKVRRDALHLLCHCMDQRGKWHESESDAVRIHRHWEDEAARRDRERKTLTTIAGGVGLLCLFVACTRPRARAA